MINVVWKKKYGHIFRILALEGIVNNGSGNVPTRWYVFYAVYYRNY